MTSASRIFRQNGNFVTKIYNAEFSLSRCLIPHYSQKIFYYKQAFVEERSRDIKLKIIILRKNPVTEIQIPNPKC